jgi:hypothetical protein
MEVDLKEVRNFLCEVRLKWYDIGLELMVTADELDEIKSRNDNDSNICLREMLKVRLFNNPLTWKAVAEALEAKPVKELALAHQGTQQYWLLSVWHGWVTFRCSFGMYQIYIRLVGDWYPV